jgi:hypothetical protein
MSNLEAEASFCKMRILLDDFFGGTTTYAVEKGLKCSFLLRGSIEDLEYGFMGDGPGRAGSAFHDKKVRIAVEGPVDQDFLQLVREHRLRHSSSLRTDDGEESIYDIAQYFGSSPCGLAFVKANLCGEQFEILAAHHEIEPVQVTLSLPMDAFEALRRQAKEAWEGREHLSATMRLIGNALPTKLNSLPELGLKLNELDISKDQGYAIQCFEVSNTRYVDADRGRVRHIARKDGEA